MIINQRYHQSCYSFCDFINIETYIGIRIFDESDTSYGWLKLGNMNQFKMTVEELACNSNSFGTQDPEQLIEIYPNPCRSMVKVTTPYYVKEGIFSLFNLNGVEIFRKETSGRINEIDMSIYSDGIYFLKYQCEKNIITEKIIKQ